MNIQPGTILISAPNLNDAHFEKVVIYLTSHNEKGATGFVINQLFPRRLNALEEFKNDIAFPLYNGGPVDQTHLFFVHRCGDMINDSTLIHNSIYVGGNFKQAVEALNNGAITANDIKIFVGYCGWDDQQLEEEIAEGSWLIVSAEDDLVFAEGLDGSWERWKHLSP